MGNASGLLNAGIAVIAGQRSNILLLIRSDHIWFSGDSGYKPPSAKVLTAAGWRFCYAPLRAPKEYPDHEDRVVDLPVCCCHIRVGC